MTTISLPKALRRTLKYRIISLLPTTPKPVKLRLALTNRCNAQCIMCNTWKSGQNGDERRNELSVDEYEKLFAKNSDVLSRLNRVSLTGGEPTLRSDLIDILRMVLKYHPDVSVNLNTNAFNTERLMRFVEEASALTERMTIMVSLDGMGDAHDVIRGVRGVFEKTFHSIDEILEFKKSNGGVRLSINHILSRHNYREFEKVFEFCTEHQIAITPIVMQKGEFFNNDDLDISLDEEATNYLTGVFERLLSEPSNVTLKNIEVFEQLKGEPRDYGCWAGKTLLLIEEEGEVFPNGGCPREWSLGNLRDCEFDLRTILCSDRAIKVFAKTKRCRRCRLACETLTTLKGPEALAGYRKLRRYE